MAVRCHPLLRGGLGLLQAAVQDDYSRYPLAWDVKADEMAFSISEVMEQAIENAQGLGHLQDDLKPTLLSDNGPGFTSHILAGYLKMHGIRHIFGTCDPWSLAYTSPDSGQDRAVPPLYQGEGVSPGLLLARRTQRSHR